MYVAQTNLFGQHCDVQRSHAYRTVYGRVLLVACTVVCVLLMWQSRVWLQRQAVLSLFSPSQQIEPVPPADGDMIVARAANRVAKVVIDADTTKIAEWNIGAEKLLGWEPEQLVGKELAVLLPGNESFIRHRDLLRDENVRNNLIKKTVEITCWVYANTGEARQINVRMRGWKDEERYYVLCELEDSSTLLPIAHSGEKPPNR